VTALQALFVVGVLPLCHNCGEAFQRMSELCPRA
jgi:predicted amidophosphoribosyltransferase